MGWNIDGKLLRRSNERREKNGVKCLDKQTLKAPRNTFISDFILLALKVEYFIQILFFVLKNVLNKNVVFFSFSLKDTADFCVLSPWNRAGSLCIP